MTGPPPVGERHRWPQARDVSRDRILLIAARAQAPLAEEGCRVAGCGHGGAMVDVSI